MKSKSLQLLKAILILIVNGPIIYLCLFLVVNMLLDSIFH